MTGTPTSIEQSLASIAPFDAMSREKLGLLARHVQQRHFLLGQTLLEEGELPAEVWILQQGTLRSLARFQPAPVPPRTLEKLEPGSLAGWISLLHQTPLEHLRASTEVYALALPASAALDLITNDAVFQQWSSAQLPAAELFDLLKKLAVQDPGFQHVLEAWPAPLASARLLSSIEPGVEISAAAASLSWYQSRPPAQPLSFPVPEVSPPHQSAGLRVIGLPPLSSSGELTIHPPSSVRRVESDESATELINIADSPLLLPVSSNDLDRPSEALKLDRAAGPRDVPLALCLSLASYFRVPANRDALRDQIDAILQRQPQLNLINYGQLISSLSLRVVLSELPARQMFRVPTPAVLMFRNQVGLLDGIDRHPSGDLARLLEPELGPVRIPVADLADVDTGLIALLLIERRPDSKNSRFSWSWYSPYLRSHRRELIEVFATSAVVNTLALVTPLGLQVLIDQVSKNANSGGALISISAVLLLSSLVGAVVRGLRSLIFTNVANRVD